MFLTAIMFIIAHLQSVASNTVKNTALYWRHYSRSEILFTSLPCNAMHATPPPACAAPSPREVLTAVFGKWIYAYYFLPLSLASFSASFSATSFLLSLLYSASVNPRSL